MEPLLIVTGRDLVLLFIAIKSPAYGNILLKNDFSRHLHI